MKVRHLVYISCLKIFHWHPCNVESTLNSMNPIFGGRVSGALSSPHPGISACLLSNPFISPGVFNYRSLTVNGCNSLFKSSVLLENIVGLRQCFHPGQRKKR